MPVSRALLYYRTLKDLKFCQLKGQVLLRLRSQKTTLPSSAHAIGQLTSFESDLAAQTSFHQGEFSALNLRQKYRKIDWNDESHGLLWAYQMNYFDFLASMEWEEGLGLIEDFKEGLTSDSIGLAPYPTSLRIINLIKFCLRHQKQQKELDHFIFAQMLLLEQNLEHHLLGNHYLENLISLVFAGSYFQDARRLDKFLPLLTEQLDEQILDDGAHFELSCMYHSIILERLFDLYNLKADVLPNFKNLLERMLSWLKIMSFSNGRWPLFNDASYSMGRSFQELRDYGQRLEIYSCELALSESGYAKMQKGDVELVIDAGEIGPHYIPGHAHCDMLSFELCFKGIDYFINSGTSTYETNQRRFYERSTKAHNTVEIEGLEQSEIWSSFRVGRKAQVEMIKRTDNFLKASCLGAFSQKHTRAFAWDSQSLLIVDQVSSPRGSRAKAYFHLHPDRSVTQLDEQGVVVDDVKVRFEGALEVNIAETQVAFEFNKLENSKCLVVDFKDELKTRVDF